MELFSKLLVDLSLGQNNDNQMDDNFQTVFCS